MRVHNKDKEDEYGEFNEHDRTRARIIIDGFTTEPATIIAGDEFDLILKIKNASNNITASNLLFSMESEKVRTVRYLPQNQVPPPWRSILCRRAG